MYGIGRGSHFVAYLGMAHCDHCNNTAKRELHAKYESTMILGIMEYSYCGVMILCPICHYGIGSDFSTPNKSMLGKLFESKKSKDKRAEVIELLRDLQSEIDIPSTRAYYNGLGWLHKRSYKTMIEQLQMNDFMVTLLHG